MPEARLVIRAKERRLLPAEPHGMTKPPAWEKSPALHRAGLAEAYCEPVGVEHADHLNDAHASASRGMTVGKREPRRPSPVAPSDEGRRTGFDSDRHRVSMLDLEP